MHVWLIFRGEKFRTEFSHLDEVRSIIPETVRVMALTATATKTTRRFFIKSLSMQTPEIIYIPPARDNILYAVMDKPKGDNAVREVFECIVDKLKTERSNMGRVILFCKTYNVISIYCKTGNVNEQVMLTNLTSGMGSLIFLPRQQLYPINNYIPSTIISRKLLLSYKQHHHSSIPTVYYLTTER